MHPHKEVTKESDCMKMLTEKSVAVTNVDVRSAAKRNHASAYTVTFERTLQAVLQENIWLHQQPIKSVPILQNTATQTRDQPKCGFNFSTVSMLEFLEKWQP